MNEGGTISSGYSNVVESLSIVPELGSIMLCLFGVTIIILEHDPENTRIALCLKIRFCRCKRAFNSVAD